MPSVRTIFWICLEKGLPIQASGFYHEVLHVFMLPSFKQDRTYCRLRNRMDLLGFCCNSKGTFTQQIEQSIRNLEKSDQILYQTEKSHTNRKNWQNPGKANKNINQYPQAQTNKQKKNTQTNKQTKQNKQTKTMAKQRHGLSKRNCLLKNTMSK